MTITTDRRATHNKPLRSAIDKTASINASQDFMRWTRSELQSVLPHGSSLCGVGQWGTAGLKLASAVACNFPRSFLGDLRTPEDRLQTFFLTRWYRQQKPQLYEPKTKVGDLPCRTNFNDYALSNLALHGVLDRESSRVTLFSFFRIPVRLNAAHARSLQLLAPHMQEALSRALAPSAEVAGKQGLSQRECEILRLIALGRTDSKIGSDLGLSPKTVGHHVANILVKLQARNRANAVAIGIGHRLISVEEKFSYIGNSPDGGKRNFR